MARLKLSEFRAKQLLVDDYQGVGVRLDSVADDIAGLTGGKNYVVKVDQGVKKRGKQGLLRLNVKKAGVKAAIKELAGLGFDRFIVEEMVSHEEREEQYLSLERVRDGLRICYSPNGGVEVESMANSVQSSLYPDNCTPLPDKVLAKWVEVMNSQHMSLIELNPFLWRDNRIELLDAAVLVDSAGEYFATSWSLEDTVDRRRLTETELTIADLNNNSPASFSFRFLNPDGSLWLLLSGGGASISIADEAQNRGMGDQLANYGEYSGGPTTEETYLYTRQILRAMLKSGAKKKALVIAGGVANFTDVQQTFKGIIEALTEVCSELQQQKIKVFVRRGGPNEAKGLAEIADFLDSYGLKGAVSGSNAVLTQAISQAMEYVR